MFGKLLRKIISSPKLKLFSALFILALISTAQGEPVIENQVEDLRLVSDVELDRALPNALFIVDMSGSMGLNYGGTQLGKWTNNQDGGVLIDCERFYCGDIRCNAGGVSDFQRTRAAHCAESAANMSVCGSKICDNDGTCGDPDEIDAFLVCICEDIHCGGDGCDATEQAAVNTCAEGGRNGNPIDSGILETAFDQECGDGDGTFEINTENVVDGCDSRNRRRRLAAAIETSHYFLNGTPFTQCSSDPPTRQCTNNGTGSDGSLGCDSNCDYSTCTGAGNGNFRDCMLDPTVNITINQGENCGFQADGVTPLSCSGAPANGSTRLDITMSVLHDLLDVDDSLADVDCQTGVNCKDFMNTGFGNVRTIVRDDVDLPNSNGDLINFITQDDADDFLARLKPLTYSGRGFWDGCTDPDTFETWTTDNNNPHASGAPERGFVDPTQDNLRAFWRFFRQYEANGGTPLANIIGFDDHNGTIPGNAGGANDVVNNDALRAFKNELETDLEVACRPQFAIVLTDGEDTCSEDPNQTVSTSNANRRSSIKAVSNLRTFYARNSVTNNGVSVDKEILTFVIGLGISEQNLQAKRTLNAMALAGGTHTKGIIRHFDLDAGADAGRISIEAQNCVTNPDLKSGDSALCGTVNDDKQPFRNLARAAGINTNPDNAHLKGCANPLENGQCQISGDNIFDNTFFDNGFPFLNDGLDNDGDGTVDNQGEDLEGFAFFVNDADELAEALADIFDIINTFTSVGVAPAAPPSSANVGLRDRIFLSLFTPHDDQRFWQGRLALYGFVDDPANVGNKIVIKKPDSGFDSDSISDINSHEIFNADGLLDPVRAPEFHWEAGKILTERNLTTDPRRIFTVDTDFTNPSVVDISTATGKEIIRYIGAHVDFDKTLSPDVFGISNADVTDPIPLFCNSDTGPITECNSSEDTAIDCTNITDTACITCVKNCIRDRVVDFISGNTEIVPKPDSLGGPNPEYDPNAPTDPPIIPPVTIGNGCPNPFIPDPMDDFSTCSVRLGDVFHSELVAVGSPSPLFFDEGFQVFARGYRERSAAIYVGANDGGIHSFHAGELCDVNDNSDSDCPSQNKNPFTNEVEEVPFFNSGTGWEMFNYISPTFLPDSIAPSVKDPNSHIHDAYTTEPPAFTPDFRFGDLKTFVVDNTLQRSFADGSSTIFDAWIDGFDNGLPENDPTDCPIATGPAAVDGKINECGKEWHTLLVSGFRNGGGGLTALDITNAECSPTGPKCTSTDSMFIDNAQEYPKHLWTLFDNDFGNSWSKAIPGRVRMKTPTAGAETVDRWLLFVGGGLDPLDVDPTDGVNFGNAFYAIDVVSGQIVYKFHPDDSRTIPDSSMINTEPSNNNIRASMTCDIAAAPGVFDLNADGYVDIAYIGDTCGRMWRFDVSRPIKTTSGVSQTGREDISGTGNLDNIGSAIIEAEDWFASIAFCANTNSECGTDASPSVPQNNVQPIFFAPTVTLDDIGQRHLIFSTGTRRDPFKVAEFSDNGTPNDPSDDFKITGTDEFGRLFNIIDAYIPAFLAGGENGTPVVPSKIMRTEDDIVDTVKLQVNSFDTDGIAETFKVQSGTTLNNPGEFIVEFPDNFSSLNGEKGIGTPVVLNRVMIFTTFAPGQDSNLPCVSNQGFGRVFALDFISGEAAITRIPGAENASQLGSASNPDDVAGIFVAEGIPSAAKLTFGAKGSVLMAISFSGGNSGSDDSASGATFLIWELPPFPTRTQTLFWEEII